ncbi:MAG: ATP phosphoribosyltransferase, partial [Bacteroidota bacterium]
MRKLKIALQKKGRLSEKSLDLLKECGIQVSNGARKLKTEARNFPLEILYLRDDDIPQYVEQGVADIGMVGENEVWEQNRDVETVLPLGFARCRLCLAVPKTAEYSDLSWFSGKTVATSYTGILKRFFVENGIEARIEKISGSVEIAPSIGLADGIFDIVSTGSTLLMNGLREVCTAKTSEAVLIATPDLASKSPEAAELLDQLLFRIRAVQAAASHKYILLNAPDSALSEISSLLPGMKSPTVLPLAESGW